MTLRYGKEFLMIPGPTNVPDEVLRAMHKPAVDIYEGPLLETTDVCLARSQRKLFRTAAQDLHLRRQRTRRLGRRA